MGGIPGYFDPFVDNKIDLDVDSQPASKFLLDDKFPILCHLSLHFRHDIVTSSLKTGFMTNEGPAFAFPSVAECLKWTHLLDRRHFAPQILAAWHGIADPKQFQSNVYKILDIPCLDALFVIIETQVFPKKISDKQHQLCYTHTCHTFTA
jgi:hypothetical protein